MAVMPMLASSVPGTSMPCRTFGSRVSGTYRTATTIAAREKGMLIQKAHRQLKSVASQPPSSGPTAAMPPIIEPYTAKAMARSRPWKRALMVERVEGITNAAPMPCTSRAPIRNAGVGAEPTASEASMNSVSPARSMSLRPWMSLSRPASRMRAANTRE